jgi:DNA-3-methyladenine glycosylase
MIEHSFFDRKTLRVAKELVGKILVRKVGRKVIREMITEVEAYVGPHDLASHARHGRTLRTEVMHQPAGTIYMYFIYGMYWMLNIVTEEKDYPAAILIRGTEHYKGPGILTRELKIDKKFNGKVLSIETGLWIEEPSPADPIKLKTYKLIRTPRIGVNYAGPVWSTKQYRFVLSSRL